MSRDRQPSSNVLNDVQQATRSLAMSVTTHVSQISSQLSGEIKLVPTYDYCRAFDVKPLGCSHCPGNPGWRSFCVQWATSDRADEPRMAGRRPCYMSGYCSAQDKNGLAITPRSASISLRGIGGSRRQLSFQAFGKLSNVRK